MSLFPSHDLSLNRYYYTFYSYHPNTPNVLNCLVYDQDQNLVETQDISFNGKTMSEMMALVENSNANPYAIGKTGTDYRSMDLTFGTVYKKSFQEKQRQKLMTYLNSNYKNVHGTSRSVFTITASGGKYYVAGYTDPAPDLWATSEGYYVFDQSDSTNISHPLVLSTQDGSSTYYSSMFTEGTRGSLNGYTIVDISAGTPDLYYYCTAHSGMGGQLLNFAAAVSYTVSVVYNDRYGHDIYQVAELANYYTDASGIYLNAGSKYAIDLSVLNGTSFNPIVGTTNDVSSSIISDNSIVNQIGDVLYVRPLLSNLYLFDQTVALMTKPLENGYYVKTIQNWTGTSVFTLMEPTESTGIVQRNLSFNAGDVVLFHVGHSSMDNFNLVFGTTVDDVGTALGNNYVSQNGDIITLDLTGYSGGAVYYFEDTSANMGYVEADITGQNTVQTEFPNADMTLNKQTGSGKNYYFLGRSYQPSNDGYSGSGSLLNQFSQFGRSLYRTSVGNGSIQSVTFNNFRIGGGHSSYTKRIMVAVHTIGNTIYQFSSNNIQGGSTNNFSDLFTSNQTYYPLVYTALDSTGVASTDCQLLNNTISFITPTPITYVYIISITEVSALLYYTSSSITSVLLLTIPKVVTVANGVFVIDGVSKPEITFTNGDTYIFDQSDSTNAGFPIVFGETPESSTLYTTGVTVVGTPGQPGAYTRIDYTGTTGALYYYSTGGSLMGYFNGYAVKTVQNWTGQDVFSIKSPNESDYTIQPDLSFNAGDTALFYIGDSSMTGYSLVFGTVLDDNTTVLGVPYVSVTTNVITLDLSSYSGGAVYYFEDSSANMGYVEAPGPNIATNFSNTSQISAGSATGNYNNRTWNQTQYGDFTDGSYNVITSTIIPSYGTASNHNAETLLIESSDRNLDHSLYDWAGNNSSYDYNPTNGATANANINTIVDGTNYYGAYAQVTMPYKLVLKDIYVRGKYVPHLPDWHYGREFMPKKVFIFGSNDNGTTLTFLKEDEIPYSSDLTHISSKAISGITEAYSTIRMVVNSIWSTTYNTALIVNHLRFTGDIIDANTTEHTVTIANGVFVIDGVSKDNITFTNGETYVFDQSDSTNAGFPIVFGTSPESSSLYTTGVTVVGTPGQAGAYTKLVYTGTTGALYYYNNIIPGMGYAQNTISYNVTVADTPPKFYLNSAKQPVIFTANTKYYFYQYDSTNENYPIVFGTVEDTEPYFTNGVTTVGTPGQAGAYTILDLTEFTGPLVYFSSGGTDMGFSEIYTVKVVQNWLGNNVFSIQAPGEDFSYNQPDLSFNAGDNVFFDVGDSSMTGYSLVFGTKIDNTGTILGSPYVTDLGSLINLNLPSDYTGGAVYYFENTNVGMGYVEAPEATYDTVIDPPYSKRGYSASYGSGYDDSRLASTKAWAAPTSNDFNQFMYIGNETNGNIGIVGVKIMPQADFPHHILKFTAEYSSDNITYTSVDNGFEFSTNFSSASPYDNNQESLIYFATPVYAQYIKIIPTEAYGFNALRAGLIQRTNTNTYTVTVSNGVFFIDTGSGAQSKPEITFTDGESYVFDQSDSTNAGYPIVFGTIPDDTSNLYTTGVTVVGTPGQPGAYTKIDYTGSTTLLYFSSGATDMGFSKIYTVKVVQNWAGNNVFSIQAPGEDLFYNQPNLSFNAGDNVFFDVGDSTMSGYSLVFGTEIDNSGTILGSPYVTDLGSLINLNLPSDYTGAAVYYFENSSTNMGYEEAPANNLKIYMNARNNYISGTSLTNLIDSTNNATTVGDITYTYIGGRGSYYLPHGHSGLTNASVKLPDVLTSNPSNELTSFTFSIYYYTTADTLSDFTRILASSHGLTEQWGHIRSINIGLSSRNGGVGDPGILLYGNLNTIINKPGTTPYNTWHHMCVTHDGTTTILYLNGVNIGSSTVTLTMVEPLLLGAYYNNGNYTDMAGYYFDAVHVYDTALSASEVTALYNNPYVNVNSYPTVNTYTVTVSNGVFFIDTGSGAQSKPNVNFTNGEIYVFDQSDPSNAGYPIVFGESKDSTPYYTNGVTVVGTPGQSGAYTRIDYTGSTALFYFSSGATGMGY